MGNNQTDHIKIWVLGIPNRPKHGYWVDQAGQKKVHGRTKQTKKVFRPDQSDQNMRIGLTEQTEIWV